MPDIASGGPVASRQQWIRWLFWLAVLASITLVLLTFRDRLDKAHVTLGYLLVVLGGSAAAGRALGLTLAGFAFLLFNYLFLPPYHTLVIADPLDWLVLVAFLITGIVAAELLNRVQERAEIARARAVEIDRFATLGAETLSAGRAEDALLGVAEVMRSALGVDCCEILAERGTPPCLVALARAGEVTGSEVGPTLRSGGVALASLASWVSANGAPAAERMDGTAWVGSSSASGDLLGWQANRGEVRALLVPLIVHERIVGVLRIAHARPITLDPAKRQFLSALSYYAALGVERVRLVAEAERAEAFRQADALKSALIGTVSHDLRTPLTTIKALAHTLASRGDPVAVSIEEEADRLNRLVADVLDLSRLAAGGMPMRLELNSAEDLIGAVVRRVEGVRGERELRVRHESGTPLLFGIFDFVQSLRVLVNLVENALKYSDASQAIELSVHSDAETLTFDVADRGLGVPAGEETRIFEAFYRPAGALSDVGSAGLGLAIARGLAVAQNGDVKYARRPGGGSVFSFSVQAASEQTADRG